jgi:hypothetical protein
LSASEQIMPGDDSLRDSERINVTHRIRLQNMGTKPAPGGAPEHFGQLLAISALVTDPQQHYRLLTSTSSFVN